MIFYRVTFAGHREVDNFIEVERKLEQIISKIVCEKEFVEFYIGNNGEFDIMATSVIRRIKEKCGKEKIALNLVLPYIKSDIEYLGSQFDSVFIPNELNNVYPKNAIKKRNRWMVAHSDVLLCYVKREFGGAAESMRYALKSGAIEIINIADLV